MRIIHSIEPLMPHLLSQIQYETDSEVRFIERANFFNYVDEYLNIEVLICRDRDNVTSIVDACPNLKMLFIVSTGVERLPFKKLMEKKIQVCNTGGINSDIMSQYAMGYILSQSVKICENLINQQLHYWKKFQCVDNLAGQNLLIVGAGRTGQLLAAKADAFGMCCIGIKRAVKPLPHFREVATLDRLIEFLPNADYVVCTIPLTSVTTNLFDYSLFCSMKSTATFINISRGRIVVTADLVRALKEEKLKSAILDVYEQEPLGYDDELWDIPNLYLSPHSSGRLENFMDKAIHYFISNYNAYLSGEPIPNIINLHDGY